MSDHFYCLDPRGELAPQSGYEREGTACNLFPDQAPGTVPLFRWFGNGDHFYTTDPAGELAPVSGYVPEGITGYLYPQQLPGTIPLFRWWGNGDHFYTTDPQGELAPQSGYSLEGIVGFVLNPVSPSGVPLFRWFSTGLMSNFTFDAAITAAQRATLLERHSWAVFRAKSCGNLSEKERNDLLNAYTKAIHHGINTDPTANASSAVGGSNIDVNFGNLFPLGDDEIAQTLIHEMMHSAGYTHPVRRDPPAAVIDVPGDGGQYYNSPPLRAELCIAGVQSDKGRVTLDLIRKGLLKRSSTKWLRASHRPSRKEEPVPH